MSIAAYASGDYFEVRDLPAWSRVSTKLTLMIWHWSYGSIPTGGQLIANPRIRLYLVESGGYPTGDQVYIEGAGYWTGTAGNWYSAGGGLPRPTTKWRCVSMTYDASSTANVPVIYIDGVAQTMATDTTPTGTATSASGATMLGNNPAGTDPAEGAVAHYAVWNRLLSANEHAHAYRFGPMSVPHGLVLYMPLDRAQPGGVTAALVGGPVSMAAMKIDARDLGDPYKGQYIGSRVNRRVGVRTTPPRTSPRIRTLTPSSVVSSSGWTPDGGATTLDEGAATRDAQYDRATDANSTMTLALSDPLVAVDTTQPVRIRVRAKHV